VEDDRRPGKKHTDQGSPLMVGNLRQSPRGRPEASSGEKQFKSKKLQIGLNPQRSLQNRPMVVTPKPANGKRGSDNIRYTPLSLGPARSFGVRSSLGERPKGASRGRVGGGGRRRRPCGNVGIARLAISKRGGKRRETAVWFSAFSTVRHFHRVIGLPPISCASSLARI
jgi:hypothetical protein